MIDFAALRSAFRSFLGDSLYHTFIEKGYNHRGGLRYWQQKEWDRFVVVHPEFNIRPDELAVAFRVCHMHGDELLPDKAEVFHGCRDFTTDYCRIRNQHFPNAAVDGVSTEGLPYERDFVEVFYCPACRAAHAKWAEMELAKRRRVGD